MPATLASISVAALANLFVLSILWVTIVGLSTKRDISAPLSHSPTFTTDPANLGIDKVSALYGPGFWASWLFVVMACCVDCIYGKREGTGRWFYFRGINANFVMAYGYPVTATVDFFMHWSEYGGAQGALAPWQGPYAARLSVIRTGAAICLGLTLIYTWTSKWSTSLLAGVLSLYLWIVWNVIDLVSHWPGLWQCISTFILLPQIGHTQVIFRLPYLNYFYGQEGYLLGNWGDIENTRTAYGYLGYFFGAVVTIGSLYVGAEHRMMGLFFILFFGTFGWWMTQIIGFFTETILLMVSEPKIALPVSGATISDDLDQMVALIVSGVFILLGVIIGVLRDNWEDITNGFSIAMSLMASGIQYIWHVTRLDGLIAWLKWESDMRRRNNVSVNF